MLISMSKLGNYHAESHRPFNHLKALTAEHSHSTSCSIITLTRMENGVEIGIIVMGRRADIARVDLSGEQPSHQINTMYLQCI